MAFALAPHPPQTTAVQLRYNPSAVSCSEVISAHLTYPRALPTANCIGGAQYIGKFENQFQSLGVRCATVLNVTDE
jgi:hypothetical protein